MSYSRAYLRGRINAGIKNKIGALTNSGDTINDVARQVLTDVRLHSMKRRVRLVPGIFQDITQYVLPADFDALIGLHPQALDKRPQLGSRPGTTVGQIDNVRLSQFELTPLEYWIQQPKRNTVAYEDIDGFSVLRAISPETNNAGMTLAALDDLNSGGGVWGAFGGAANVVADTGNYVLGNASVRYDISAVVDGTAGIVNATMTPFNFASFLKSNGAIFTYADIANIVDITSFEIRIGTDATNYYSVIATTQQNGNAFTEGVNLIRFDLSGASIVGAPSSTAAVYCALFMNKNVAKVSQSPFRFDHIIFRLGDVYEADYYSFYPWRDLAGVRKLNATLDSDVLMAEPDEIDLFIQKGIEVAAPEVDEDGAMQTAATKYSRMLKAYMMASPSEEMLMSYEYQKFI